MKRLFGTLTAAVAISLATAWSASAAMMSPGDPFPAWKLSDQTGGEVSSAAYAGRPYLLWFYPKARTPG